ncbi:MAG: zinc-ribbon domain-containing protein [Gemmatales bacterium]
MKITCPECSERFDVSSDMIGKKAKCGECAHVFVVPDLVEKKAKKQKPDVEEASDIRQTAWLSLYLAAISLGMLLYSGHQGGMMASLLFGLAIETAALYLAWRGFMNSWSLRDEETETRLIKTGILVNGILMGLLGLSILLTVYTMIGGQSAGGMGGLGGLDTIMKGYQDALKSIK